MLKDITLGQYFPGKSVIHRLDPRTKLILLVVYIVALFMAVSWVSYAILAVFLVVLAILEVPFFGHKNSLCSCSLHRLFVGQ